MLGGKAVIVNGYKCIGHSLCAEVCPVGAIAMVMASPSMGGDMAFPTPLYETTLKNLFIVGELGGLALIKNQSIRIVTASITSLAESRHWGVAGPSRASTMR